MRVGLCIGRRRVCSFCGRKFEDTEETVLAEEDSEEILLCFRGDSPNDESICLKGWRKSHPNFFFNFFKIKLAFVETYMTWPPELARVT